MIQKVNIGSDHRLIRGTIRINTRMERSKMTRAKKPKLNIGRLLMKKEEFQIKLQNRFELVGSEGHVEDITWKITEALQQSAMETAGRDRRKKEEKLKPKTKDLMKKGRDMVKQGTARERVKYSELCKTIRKMMRDDIREHNTLKIKEAMETGKA